MWGSGLGSPSYIHHALREVIMHDAAYAADARKALPADVVESPFYSDDLAPVPQAHRTWNTYAFAALWISMCHCIPTYSLAGGIVGSGMNWWQALLTIGVGTGLVLVPILLNAHPGTQYGVPFPVLARSSFGVMGANIPAMLRAVVACGWFGINCYFGGEGVSALIATRVAGLGDARRRPGHRRAIPCPTSSRSPCSGQ